MSEWRQFEGGARWRYLCDGRIVLEDAEANIEPIVRKGKRVGAYLWSTCELDNDGALRTKGRPLSMRSMWGDYGEHMTEASERFDIPVSWIGGMISIEANKRGFKWDPVSNRYEKGIDEWSSGLMQTLVKTGRAMLEEYPRLQSLLNIRPRELTKEHQHDPRVSILLGTAYMRYQIDRTPPHGRKGFTGEASDLILLCGSYNCGRLVKTTSIPWRVKSFGYTRIPKMVAYHNDLLAVLED